MTRKYSNGISSSSTKSKDSFGFTLIELMVVMTLIIIVLSMTWIFISGMRRDAIRDAGQIIKATFMRASQLASSQRMMYFLVLNKQNSTMSIFEDTNLNGQYDIPSSDAVVDKQVGETIVLPKGVTFSKDMTLFKDDDKVIIGFNSNGSLSVSEDKSFNPGIDADIILEQQSAPGKMYLDYSITTGRIGKMAYIIPDK